MYKSDEGPYIAHLCHSRRRLRFQIADIPIEVEYLMDWFRTGVSQNPKKNLIRGYPNPNSRANILIKFSRSQSCETEFENSTWNIPKQRMKGRTPHVVYLSRRTLDIFVALHTCATGSKFVLPSRYEADRCMSNATLNRSPQSWQNGPTPPASYFCAFESKRVIWSKAASLA